MNDQVSPEPEVTCVCSIGTSDPWNAAGIGLDIAVFADLHTRACTVIAAVSAQDGAQQFSVSPLAPALIRAQCDALGAAPIGAFRIGALVGAKQAGVIAEWLDSRAGPVVLDPVFTTSAGGIFADDATVRAITKKLFPRAAIVTPNIDEASRMLRRSITTVDEMEAAARELLELGAQAVLLTGGHLPGDPVDVLATRDGVERFFAKRLPLGMRGTGCVLAAATAVRLTLGSDIREAVVFARSYVRFSIENAREFGPMRTAF